MGGHPAVVAALLILVCVFVNSASAISLYASSGPYPADCPIIIKGEPGSTISIYSMKDEYIGNCIIPFYSDYCVFSLNEKYGDGAYRITDGSSHLFISFSKSAPCLNCFIDDKPYPRGMESPSNPNEFCDVSSPWAWSTRPLAGVVVSPASITVGQNQMYIFRAYGFDVNNNTVQIAPEWKSGNPQVGEINSHGAFTAKTSGTAIITATYNGLSANSSVEVVVIARPDYEKILSLSAPGAARFGDTLLVRVSRLDGAPFANKTVTILTPNQDITLNALTDEDGRFVFKVPEPGVYTYEVQGYSFEKTVSTFVEEQPPTACQVCANATCPNQTNACQAQQLQQQPQQPITSRITAYFGRMSGYAPVAMAVIILLAFVFGYLLFVRYRGSKAEAESSQFEGLSPEKGEETKIWTVDDFETPPLYAPPKTLAAPHSAKTKKAKRATKGKPRR